MALLDGEPGTGDVLHTGGDPLVDLPGEAGGGEEGGLVADLDDVGGVAELGLLDPGELLDLEGLSCTKAGSLLGVSVSCQYIEISSTWSKRASRLS